MNNNKINQIISSKLLTQIIRFIIVGGCATIIDFIIFFTMHSILSIDIIISNITSFIGGLLFNYFISITWVFNTNKDNNKKNQFILFTIFSIIGLIINTLIVYICSNIINIYPMISKVYATGIVMIFNFITRKLFLEKRYN